MSKQLSPEEFLALPQPKKAVLLAKDVIAQIKAKRLNVACGSYIELNTMGDDESVYDKLSGLAEQSAKDHLNIILPHCVVCAKGALFMCHIGRANKATVDQAIYEQGSSSIKRRLVVEDGVFDELSFDLIETAFERDYFGVVVRHERFDEALQTWVEPSESEENLKRLADKAITFGGRFREDDHRLVAIMLNVIRNKGKFVPSDRVTREAVRDALKVTKK